MVIDPAKLLQEIKQLNPDSIIRVSDRAHVTQACHLDRDASGSSVGSTRRGIGPTYTDKYSRAGVTMGQHVSQEAQEFDRRQGECPWATKLIDCQYLLKFLDEKGYRFLFEGAQGVMLDIDFGTYPYVTSSHTSFLGVGQGTGFSPRKINKVIGVTKVYCTRVGDGPFVTEDEALRVTLKAKGIEEKGATTGRDRKVGHLNIDELRYAIDVSDVDELVLTKTDALAGIGAVLVFVNGRYENWQGWNSAKSVHDMRPFMNRLEKAVSCPVKYVSYGPGSEEIMEV